MPPKVSVAASNDGALPEDVLRHILVRLPAKTVCLFRAVCRSWRSLLLDPLFVAAHKSRHPGPLIVTCNCEMFERGTINLLDLSGHVVKRIATTMKDARMVRTRRLDLICVTGRKGYHVINPATGSMALFNLETEEWMGIVQGPTPVCSFVKDSNGRCGYFSLYLELSVVNLDGFLVMAHNPEGCSLDLWFLMDIKKCLWNKRYSLDFQPENLFAQPLEILNDGKIVLSAPGSLRL